MRAIDVLEHRQDERDCLLRNERILGEEVVAFRGDDRDPLRKEQVRQEGQAIIRPVGPQKQLLVPPEA